LPPGTRTRDLFGISAAAGIGFTVSLFVADLAFRGEALQDQAKLGVLLASVLAAIVGSILLWSFPLMEALGLSSDEPTGGDEADRVEADAGDAGPGGDEEAAREAAGQPGADEGS
jgi:NhaA family Na+:H+ antiporter